MNLEHDMGSSCDHGASIPQRLPRVHIERVDYELMTLFDADGNEYCELPDSTWVIVGQPCEGSIRYWGSGSHAGHINLFPLLYYTKGQWVNIRTGKPCS